MDLRDFEAAKRSPKEVLAAKSQRHWQDREKQHGGLFHLFLMPVFGAISCVYAQCTQESLEFLHQCIDGQVPLQVGGQPARHLKKCKQRFAMLQDAEENYALNIQETDFVKLADFTRFLFLWDKDTTCPSPGCWYCLSLPYNLHQPAQEVQNIWCILIEPVGNSIEGSRSKGFL